MARPKTSRVASGISGTIDSGILRGLPLFFGKFSINGMYQNFPTFGISGRPIHELLSKYDTSARCFDRTITKKEGGGHRVREHSSDKNADTRSADNRCLTYSRPKKGGVLHP